MNRWFAFGAKALVAVGGILLADNYLQGQTKSLMEMVVTVAALLTRSPRES